MQTIQYIGDHLGETLSLEKISEMASYSPHHFHRIFKLTVGETLQNYVIRKRVEKSAFYLALKKNLSLQDIYRRLGFTDHSSFNRTFRRFYGISPSQFRNSAPENFHRIFPEKIGSSHTAPVFDQYSDNLDNLLDFARMNLNIKINELPEMNLAAVMSLGIAGVEKSYGILISWAEREKLFPGENVKMISVYHDSFKVTAPDKVRIHACMLLDEPMKKSEGEIFSEKIAAGKFIVGSAEVTLQDFEKCWVSLFLWMKENGFSTRNAFPFEIYHTNYKHHPEGKMNVDFCIPVE